MLTIVSKSRYSHSAPINLGVGIDLPCNGRQGAHSKRFFIACSLWQAVWGLFGAPILVTGKVNSAQSAALLIDLNGGSFRQCNEGSTMSNNDNLIHLSMCLFGQLSDQEQKMFLIFLQSYLVYLEGR